MKTITNTKAFRLVVIALLLGCSQFSSAGRLGPGLPAPGTYVWIGQQRLHLNCTGIGSPTVILEAGLGGTSLEWSKVQPDVARITRVCSYDRAGYGWSDAGPAPRTSAAIVDELTKLLRFGSVAAPYVLVGHSFGGLGMRLFAARHPDRIAGLLMIDSTHENQFDSASDKLEKSLIPRGNKAFFIGNQHQIPTDLPIDLIPTARILAGIPDSVRTLYNELRNIRVSAAQVRAARTRVLVAPMTVIPMTVIAHDSVSRAKSAKSRRFAQHWMALQQELASRSVNGELIVAHGSGHHVHLERPALVVAAIRQLVERSRRDSAVQ